MTVSTADISVLHSQEVALLYPQVVSYASCSSHFLRCDGYQAHYETVMKDHVGKV
jgi:hypothetical protein